MKRKKGLKKLSKKDAKAPKSILNDIEEYYEASAYAGFGS